MFYYHNDDSGTVTYQRWKQKNEEVFRGMEHRKVTNDRLTTSFGTLFYCK